MEFELGEVYTSLPSTPFNGGELVSGFILTTSADVTPSFCQSTEDACKPRVPARPAERA